MSASNILKNKVGGKMVGGEIDDFWNDCINIDPSRQNSKNNNSNENSEQYITFNENPKSKKAAKTSNTIGITHNDSNIGNTTNLSNVSMNMKASESNNSFSIPQKKFKNLLQKYNFDRLWTKEELDEKEKEELRKKRSMERSFQLYEKGKVKNEVNRIMYHKNEELKIQNELKECTWKPKLNKINKKMEENLKIITKDTKIYNRSLKWKNKNNQRINKSKSEMQRVSFNNTYKPMVNSNPNLNSVFNNSKTVYKDHSNRSFIYRYEKVREENEEKNRKLAQTTTQQLKDKWSRSNLNRSVSVSGYHKQNLHDELHSIKYIDSD